MCIDIQYSLNQIPSFAKRGRGDLAVVIYGEIQLSLTIISVAQP